MAEDLVDLHFSQQFLTRHNLPNGPYPVTPEALEQIVGDPEQLPFAQMLFGLQLRAAEAETDWKGLEPALCRLAEIIAPDDDRLSIEVGGDTWWIEIAPVNLASELIAIQRGDALIAAIAARSDGRLCLATYTPLDSRSADLLIGLAVLPHQGMVCMRDNNWEYALDCAAATGQVYAAERGESYLGYWPSGLGQRGSSVDGHWFAERTRVPRSPAEVATELGVHYALNPDE